MAQTDGHVPELTPDPRKCFLKKVDQSQSAPLHRLQSVSLPCSRSRVIPGKTAESRSLFNILLGRGIICTAWQIVAHHFIIFFIVCVFVCLCTCVCVLKLIPSNCFSVIFQISKKITWNVCMAQKNIVKRPKIRCELYKWRVQPNRSIGSYGSESCLKPRVHTFIFPWALFSKLCVSFYGICALNAKGVHCTIGSPESDFPGIAWITYSVRMCMYAHAVCFQCESVCKSLWAVAQC